MSRTKKQHYISQSILNNFFKVDKIHEYNLKRGNDYDCSIADSMCCADIYESSLYDDNKLENAFAQLYDGQFATKLMNIDSNLSSGNISSAIDILKHNFYYYTVSYYKSLASLIRLSKNDKQFLEKNNATTRMFKLITNVDYMKRISLILTNCYDIFIIKSSKSNFVLCDQFISTASNHFNGLFTNISNRDIGVKGSIILLPISIDYYFLLYDKTMKDDISMKLDEINYLSDAETDKINNIIYNNATEKVCSAKNSSYNFVNVNSYGDETTYTVFKNYNTKGFKKKKEIFYSDFEQEVYTTFMEMNWGNYMNLGRNEICYCGSNKKFKKCCINKIDRCKSIYNSIKCNKLNEQSIINNYLGIEEPVEL